MRRADVIVAGGGPAGTATAIAAQALGLRVSLLTGPPVRRSERFETLTPGGIAALRDLGLLPTFEAERFPLCTGISSSWGNTSLHENDALFHPFGASWLVERGRFDALLLRCVADRDIRVLAGAVVAGCERDAGGAQIVTVARDGRTMRIRAPMVVDATGRHALVARERGARSCAFDDLVAMTAVLPRAREAMRRYRPLIESVPDGWWFAVDADDDRLSLTCVTDSMTVREHGGPRQLWRAALRASAHVSRRVGAFEPDALHVVTASPRLTMPLAGDGWTAAGDAAASWDPLSSQGLTNALRAGFDCARAIASESTVALSAYARSAAERFFGQLDTRADYYAREQRWPEAPFWQRRLANGQAA